VRRVRRTVKRSVNRSSFTCKRKVCFSRVVCTFSVLEGVPKIGKLQNATMCSFDTRSPGSSVVRGTRMDLCFDVRDDRNSHVTSGWAQMQF
jgi:hypothetical protein